MVAVVTIRFDPKCKEASLLVEEQEAEIHLAKDLPGTRLWHVLSQRRDKAYKEHDAECLLCWTYARRCSECKVDLTTGAHRFTCRLNAHRWHGLLRKRGPPLAAEARRRPREGAPLETPPPRRVPLEQATRKAAPAPPPAPARPRPTAYEVLGVKPGATVAAIRAAYREKAMEFHPDRVASLGPGARRLAEAKMREINEAYEALLRQVASAK